MYVPRFRLAATLAGHQAAIYSVVEGKEPWTFLTSGGDGWIVRWDVRDPDPGQVIATVEGQVFALATHAATGHYLAGTMQGDLHWFEDGKTSRTAAMRHHDGGTYAILPSDQVIWTAGGDGRITQWDPATRRPIHSIRIATKAVRKLAFHKDLCLLAAGTSDGTICILDANTLSLIVRIENAHDPSVFSLAFSADGQTLWSGGRDARIRVWDIGGKQIGPEVQGHWYTVNSLFMDPRGGFMVSASRDRTIRIWDPASRQLLQGLETVRDGGHRNSVNDLLWMEEFHTLVAVSDDRTVSLWSCLPAQGPS